MWSCNIDFFFFFKQKTAYEIIGVTGVQTCALPISDEGLVGAGDPEAGGGRGRSGSRTGRRRRFQLVHTIVEILDRDDQAEIGRASCRERGEISVVAGSLKKKK